MASPRSNGLFAATLTATGLLGVAVGSPQGPPPTDHHKTVTLPNAPEVTLAVYWTRQPGAQNLLRAGKLRMRTSASRSIAKLSNTGNRSSFARPRKSRARLNVNSPPTLLSRGSAALDRSHVNASPPQYHMPCADKRSLTSTNSVCAGVLRPLKLYICILSAQRTYRT